MERKTLIIVCDSSIVSLEYGNFAIDYDPNEFVMTVILLNNQDKMIKVNNITENQFNKIKNKIREQPDCINIAGSVTFSQF